MDRSGGRGKDDQERVKSGEERGKKIREMKIIGGGRWKTGRGGKRNGWN